MNVSESGVQWARCLRVRVRIDVTKRMVCGKKIAIEGGEGKWVQFKYETLPNFCYRCGLLSHALKDCQELRESNIVGEKEELQYRAWLRGEILRRYMEKGVGSRHGESGDETELRSGLVLARGSSKDDDKDHVPNQAILKPCPLPLRETGADSLNQKPKTLHENGMVKGFVRKLGEKEAILDEIALDQPKAQSRATEKMLWETATSHEGTPSSNYVLVPNPEFNNEEDNPMSSSAELGLLVKNCDLGNGWSAEHFGPNACDNIKEVSTSSFSGPNRKLNPSPRGGRIRTRVQPVTKTNKGKSDSKILDTKHDVRVAFEEEEERGRGKRQAVEDASIQTAAADVQPRQHQ